MKRCKHITGWTDYPFHELGDVSGVQAPIRRIRVLCYNNDKYATVEIIGGGLVTQIKAGYIYSQKGRCCDVPTISRRKLERMIPMITPWYN